VARILAETGLRGDRLTLEIVESEQMDDEAARTQLRQVAALGVRIALDDFGAGYISLASLRSYPIHQIKMAPTFLTATDDGAMQLVISVGEVLGAETVAQGLAAESDAARLRQTAVTAGQGPLVGGAMAAADVGRWLSDHLARR
jgi:EAL domain-containing protein (putative c-di-GMP-specific phosphodiesterase class I)